VSVYPTGTLSDRPFRDAVECRRESIYGGVGYTRESTSGEPGSIELEVRQRETVDIPMMASAGAIAPGAFLMLAGEDQAIRQRIAGAIRRTAGVGSVEGP
jgi:hypothetical protein